MCSVTRTHEDTMHTQAHTYRHTHTFSSFTPTHPHTLRVTHVHTDTHTCPGLPVPKLPHTPTDPDPPTPFCLPGGLHPVWCPRLKPLATWHPGARSWQPRKSETRIEYLNLTQGSVLGDRYRPGHPGTSAETGTGSRRGSQDQTGAGGAHHPFVGGAPIRCRWLSHQTRRWLPAGLPS